MMTSHMHIYLQHVICLDDQIHEGVYSHDPLSLSCREYIITKQKEECVIAGNEGHFMDNIGWNNTWLHIWKAYHIPCNAHYKVDCFVSVYWWKNRKHLARISFVRMTIMCILGFYGDDLGFTPLFHIMHGLNQCWYSTGIRNYRSWWLNAKKPCLSLYLHLCSH
jgi:hypothetical protein